MSTYKCPNHNIFHKTNLLSDREFKNLVEYKENVVDKGTAATTIHADGEITQDKRIHAVNKNTIFNLLLDIEAFGPYYGKPIVDLMYAIQTQLKEFGAKNPRAHSAQINRANGPCGWHKHPSIIKGNERKPSKLWATIYYLHPNWDVKYDGKLHIGLIETEILYEANCYSNSLIAHTGYYGHTVKCVNPGFEDNRDTLVMNWTVD